MATSNVQVTPTESDEAKEEALKRANRRKRILALVMVVLFIVGCIATLGPVALVPTVTTAGLTGLSTEFGLGVLALLACGVFYFRSL